MKRKKFPIDLSMLTEEEIDQFREDSTTLYEGVVDVALYLRFSSSGRKNSPLKDSFETVSHTAREKATA